MRSLFALFFRKSGGKSSVGHLGSWLLRRAHRQLAAAGAWAIEIVAAIRYTISVFGGLVHLALHRRYWTGTVRDVLARQILFTAVEATRFVSLVGLLVGVAVVVQVQLLVATAGQSHLLGPLIVMVVVRELAPVIVNLVVIGRSGTAIVAELGAMKVSGQIRCLDAQGVDPSVYVVLPRVVGMAASVFALTLVFILVALLSGYAFGVFWGVTRLGPWGFVNSVLRALSPNDAVILLIKTTLPAVLAGIICCVEGLGVVAVDTEVPRAITRAFGRSVAVLFVVAVGVSILTYL